MWGKGESNRWCSQPSPQDSALLYRDPAGPIRKPGIVSAPDRRSRLPALAYRNEISAMKRRCSALGRLRYARRPRLRSATALLAVAAWHIHRFTLSAPSGNSKTMSVGATEMGCPFQRSPLLNPADDYQLPVEVRARPRYRESLRLRLPPVPTRSRKKYPSLRRPLYVIPMAELRKAKAVFGV